MFLWHSLKSRAPQIFHAKSIKSYRLFPESLVSSTKCVILGLTIQLQFNLKAPKVPGGTIKQNII